MDSCQGGLSWIQTEWEAMIPRIGPQFVGIILLWGLFGVLSIQVYLYFHTFSKDRPALKALVCIIYLLQTAQTILLTESQWKTFINGPRYCWISEGLWLDWLSLYAIGGSLALFVQQFYAYRIYVISQNKGITGFIMVTSLASFSGALTEAAFTEPTYSKPRPFYGELVADTPIQLWMGLGSVCDIMIVVSMCYYLRRRARGSPFRTTHALISKIVRLTVETGTLTASISILVLSFYIFGTMDDDIKNFYWFFPAPLFILASIYSTTMMAVLNSRIKLGITSESSTWLDNELIISMAHNQETPGIVFNIAPTVNTSMETGLPSAGQLATSDSVSEVIMKGLETPNLQRNNSAKLRVTQGDKRFKILNYHVEVKRNNNYDQGATEIRFITRAYYE